MNLARTDGVRCLSSAAIAAACLALTNPAASGQTLEGLGTLPFPNSSPRVAAISGDGSTVVGIDAHPQRDEPTAVRWVRGTGWELLMPELEYSGANAVSHNGSVVVGFASVEGFGFRWTVATGAQPLGTLTSNAAAVSSDGTVIVGGLFVNPEKQKEHACRWTLENGFTDLGVIPGGWVARGTGVSGDGAVIAGWSYIGPQIFAFRWTQETGMESLGTLPEGSYSSAAAISRDGEVIVGRADVGGPTHMFRWTASNGMEDLGRLAGWQYALANATNADGSVIVGEAYQPGGGDSRAILWKRGLGVVNLNTYLVDAGVDLTGWILSDAIGVSDDGRTIVGMGAHIGRYEAWIATLPSCPADFNENFLVNSQDFFDFLTAYFGADPGADFNEDGEVNSADFFDFISEFMGGCD